MRCKNWPEEICRFYVSRQHLLSCGKGRKSAKIDISIRKTHREQWKKGVGREIEAGDTAAHAGIES